MIIIRDFDDFDTTTIRADAKDVIKTGTKGMATSAINNPPTDDTNSIHEKKKTKTSLNTGDGTTHIKIFLEGYIKPLAISGKRDDIIEVSGSKKNATY